MIADRIRSWHATHAGTKRKYNEDTWVDRPDLGIWAVADGAGGHQAGEYASGLIAEALEFDAAGTFRRRIARRGAGADRRIPTRRCARRPNAAAATR